MPNFLVYCVAIVFALSIVACGSPAVSTLTESENITTLSYDQVGILMDCFDKKTANTANPTSYGYKMGRALFLDKDQATIVKELAPAIRQAQAAGCTVPNSSVRRSLASPSATPEKTAAPKTESSTETRDSALGKPTDKNELRQVDIPKLGFSVSLPATWKEFSSTNTSMIFTENSPNGDIVTFAVGIVPDPGTSLSDLAKRMKASSEKENGGEVKSEGFLRIDNKEAVFVNYLSKNIVSVGEPTTRQGVRYGILGGNQFQYEVGLTVEQKRFPEFQILFDAIVKSIRITQPQVNES